MFEIRKAVLADAERIAQIHAETWRAAYHDFIPEDFPDNQAGLEPRREMWNTLLSREHDSHYAVVKDGTIVGFFSLEQSCGGDLRNACELVCLYFDMAYCHMGFGSQTMRFIIAQAKQRGWNEIFLWVFRQNQSAISFYGKFGFHFDGATNVLPLGKPVTECRYRLVLTDS